MKMPKSVSYRRSIENSIGFFYQSNKSGVQTPVYLERKTLVGPFCDIASASGSNQKNTNALNIFTTDLAILSQDTCEFCIECSLCLLQNWRTPYRSEDESASRTLTEFTNEYLALDGFHTLSAAYAENIISNHWGWRNTETFMVGRRSIVEFNDKAYTFTIPDHSKKPTIDDLMACNNHKDINSVIMFIKDALTKKNAPGELKLKAIFTVHPGREVFPSQEFIDDSDYYSKENKQGTRVLASIWTKEKRRQAIFHKTKISNAFHRIDRWYENSYDSQPISINPLGYEQQENKSYRNWASGLDLYHLLMKLEQITEDMISTKTPSPHSHFIAANLVHGGLFTSQKGMKQKNEDG